jgi:hypothetical protein
MGGFIRIDRQISPDVLQYVMIDRIKLRYWNNFGILIFPSLIVAGIVSGIMDRFSFSITIFIIIAINLIKAIYDYIKGKKESNKLYNLLKTGIITKASLKYIHSKNATKHPDRQNMRYFYELKYFDLNDNAVVFRFVFLQELNEEIYKDIPVIFSASNPKEAVIFHQCFYPSKDKLKGLIRDSRLCVVDGKISL